MKVSNRDIALLLGFLGIAAAFCVYYFIFMKYTAATEELQAVNRDLKTRVDTLQMLVDEQSDMEQAITANNLESKQILDHFPIDVREEDIVMMAVHMEREAPFYLVKGISMEEPEQLYTFRDVEVLTDEEVKKYLPKKAPLSDEAEGAEIPEPAVQASLGETPILYKKPGNIVAITGYEGLKNACKYILDRYDRSAIFVVADYDVETGLLQASLTVEPCYVTSTDKTYVAPDIPFVSTGTDDIFGTINAPMSVEGFYNVIHAAEDILNAGTDENAEESAE